MIVRPALKAYGLLLFVFTIIAYLTLEDRLQQRQDVLNDTAFVATQQSQQIAEAVSVFHVMTNYLLSDVISRVDHQHLESQEHEQKLDRIYNGLLQNKLAQVPFLKGLAILGNDCSVLVASGESHREFGRSDAHCDQLREAELAQHTQTHLFSSEQTLHGGQVIAFTRNIVGLGGEFLGAITTTLDLGFIHSWFSQYPLRENESIALMGDQGQLLIQITKGLAMDDARFAFDRVMFQKPFKSPQTPRPQSQNDINEDAVFAMSKIDVLPMYVVVNYNLDAHLAHWRKHSIQAGIFLFALLIVSLLSVKAYLSVLRQREALAKLAVTDSLTGAFNRRHFMKIGRDEVSRATEHGRPLTLLLIDADHFKEVNDRWGHRAGDLVLKAISGLIADSLRHSDMAARIGGEEFVVLLPETSLKNAEVLASRLCQTIANSSIAVTACEQTNVTVSIGVATLHEDETLDQLMSRADHSLYGAKEKGRNQVVIAQS